MPMEENRKPDRTAPWWACLLLCLSSLAAAVRVDETGPAWKQPLELGRIEQLVFQLVNRERARAGCTEVRYDDRLAEMARLHSANMKQFSFFAHVDLDGLDPMGRKVRHYPELFAERVAENIATAFGSSEAVIASSLMTNWMHSPGHRRNILDPAFTHIGVGIVAGVGEKLYATQDFARELIRLETALPAEVKFGTSIEFEFELRGAIPPDELRIVVIFPDPNLKFYLSSGEYYLGKGFYRPRWSGAHGRVLFKCNQGRGRYRIAVGRAGSYFPPFLEFAVR